MCVSIEVVVAIELESGEKWWRWKVMKVMKVVVDCLAAQTPTIQHNKKARVCLASHLLTCDSELQFTPAPAAPALEVPESSDEVKACCLLFVHQVCFVSQIIHHLVQLAFATSP